MGQIQQQPQLQQPGMGGANVVSAPPPGAGATQQMVTNSSSSAGCSYGGEQLVSKWQCVYDSIVMIILSLSLSPCSSHNTIHTRAAVTVQSHLINLET